jgi:ribosomal protein L16/L10AE
MVVFTRKYILQRQLKKRFFKKNKIPKLRYGTSGLYCLHTFRFEYRYCLFLRKFFKRLFHKKKRKIATIPRRRTWLFIRPNYVLTHKSKNARMGKGKGNFKRWCTIIYPGRIFIEHLNVPYFLYKKYVWKIKIKLKLQLYIIHKIFINVKKQSISGSPTNTSGTFELIRHRKSIYSTQRYFEEMIYKNLYF